MLWEGVSVAGVQAAACGVGTPREGSPGAGGPSQGKEVGRGVMVAGERHRGSRDAMQVGREEAQEVGTTGAPRAGAPVSWKAGMSARTWGRAWLLSTLSHLPVFVKGDWPRICSGTRVWAV